MTILMGISGEQGSFSEEAAFLYADKKNIQPNFQYLIDMAGVLKALNQSEIDLGIFPVINLTGGLVKQAFLAMGKYLFHPIDELWLNVKQCLLTHPETASHDIKRIVSHPQALIQCKQYIEKYYKQVQIEEWPDTAKAAKDLASGILDSNTAVLAPERSAYLYHLNVLAKNIQDSKNNLTAFIVVKKFVTKTI